MSQPLNLQIVTGFSFLQPIELIGRDDTGTEFPFPLTGRTVTAIAKPNANSCKSYEFVINVTDAANGEFNLEMLPSVTVTITEPTLVYDVRITDASDPDWSYRAVFGTITVSKEITP